MSIPPSRPGSTTARPGGDAPPPVGPPPEGPRPFWSVMVPTYEPSTLLEETLRAVLDQDPGPEAMQIAVVDDRSPSGRRRGDGAAGRPERPGRGAPGRGQPRPGRQLEPGHWAGPGPMGPPACTRTTGSCPASTRPSAGPTPRLPTPAPPTAAMPSLTGTATGRASRRWSGDDPGVVEDCWGGSSRSSASSAPRSSCGGRPSRRWAATGGTCRYTLDWEMWCRIAARLPDLVRADGNGLLPPARGERDGGA